MNKLRAD